MPVRCSWGLYDKYKNSKTSIGVLEMTAVEKALAELWRLRGGLDGALMPRETYEKESQDIAFLAVNAIKTLHEEKSALEKENSRLKEEKNTETSKAIPVRITSKVSGRVIERAYTAKQLVEFMDEDDMVATMSQCNCQSVGETNVVECNCEDEWEDYMLEWL